MSRGAAAIAAVLASIGSAGCGTPMERAVRSGDHARAKDLLLTEKGPEARKGDYRMFYIAANRGDLEMVKVLFDGGAFLDPKTVGPLAEAAMSGNRELCRYLIAKGQDAQAAIDYLHDLKPRHSTGNWPGADNGIRILTSLLPPGPAALAAAPPVATVLAGPEPPASLSPRFTAPERPDDLAVIVGIETYSDIASKAPYAERDADAFKAHVRALGVPERNIVLLKGAKAGKASIEKNLEQWLPRMAKADSRVYFYFSGHGAPDVRTGQAYLVPWDGDPNFLESTAYPVAKLYKRLGGLPAKQILVAMDSCFSGAGGRSVLASGARPLVGRIDAGAVPPKVTVLAASAGHEISGSLDDKGHGAFTYFLLEGLNAGKTTPKALNEYLTPRVQDEARRLNRDQTPQLQGDGGWPLR